MSRHPSAKQKAIPQNQRHRFKGAYKKVTAAQFQALLRLYSRVTPGQRMTDAGHLAPVNKS